jgi:hypothetical protein
MEREMSILNPRKALLIPLLGVGLLVAGSAIDGNKITKFNTSKESNEQALARIGGCIPYVDKGRLIEGEVYVTYEPDPKDPSKTIEQRLGDGNHLCDLAGNTAQTIGSAANYYRTADYKQFTKAMAAKFSLPMVENQTEPAMPTAQEIVDSGAVVAHKSKHYRPNLAKRQHKPKPTDSNWFMGLFQPKKSH